MLKKVAAVAAFGVFFIIFVQLLEGVCPATFPLLYLSCSFSVFKVLLDDSYSITYSKSSNKATMLEVKFSCVRDQKKKKKKEKDYSLGIKSKTFHSDVREH